MKIQWLAKGCLLAALILTISCNSGGGGTTAATNSSGETLSGLSTGFSVPTEVSAVSSSTSGSGKPVTGVALGLKSAILGLATDSGTDYTKAQTVKFVNEHTLEQFDIIEQVLEALAQTKYSDAANINQGPYKAMVAWSEESNGIETKKLEPWIVDSRMIVENGVDVNRVLIWLTEFENGQAINVQAEFKVYASATQNADGSYADFGVWKMNVKFGDSGQDYFVASADVVNGVSVIKLHDRFPMGEGRVEEHKAILFKSNTTGYGKVSFPDWESVDWGSCGSNCFPQATAAVYAFNADYLSVQKSGQGARHVNRNQTTEMTHRYGVFDATTGNDINRSKTFGFPVSFTLNGTPMFGYYGAWQGRHQLWAGGPDTSIPAGTVVTRQDRGSNQTAETYTVAESISGTLVKRDTVSAAVGDVKDIPVETWINEFYNLLYNSSQSKWFNCKNPSWGMSGMTCESQEDFTSMLPTLAVSLSDNRKFVNINRWDQTSQSMTNYVYLTSGPSGAGFYVATMDTSTGRYTATTTKYNPSDNDQLWASVGGSIYIMFNGTSWVEKTVSSFDTRTWTPTFDDLADKPYTLPLNQELYINIKGANYIVKRTGDSTYDVKAEIQSVANPANATTFVASGTVFKSAWNPDNDSTFTFDTDSTSSTFMKLKYASIGDNDRDQNGNPNTGVSVGGVVTRGLWGLMAYVNGTSTGTQFNWDYPREGENWGKITYLKDSNGNYVLLDDPVRFTPVTLTNGAGESKTLALQFDGWMHGLPDMFEELRKNDFSLSTSLKNKIINIPAGTQVADATDSTKTYLIKPLEVSIFLDPITDTTGLSLPSLSSAESLDLSTIPAFQDPNLGAAPTVTGTKYSEGKLIQ